MGVFACWVWRNDRFASTLVEPVAQPPRVISTVGEQATRCRNAFKQQRDTREVVSLSWRQAKGDGPPDLIGQGMNLGRPSAARSPDGLRELPPFPPDAERCALIEVLSALVVPTTPEDPDKT